MADVPEPSIVCRYGPLDLPAALADLDTLMRSLAPGDVLRLETEQCDAPDALATWCKRTGNRVIQSTEALELIHRSCVRLHVLDIQRGMQ